MRQKNLQFVVYTFQKMKAYFKACSANGVAASFFTSLYLLSPYL
jgi:hypothetical protein